MSLEKHGPIAGVVLEWEDLSDAELRTRLMQRGIDPVKAKGWVQERETQRATGLITEALGGDPVPVKERAAGDTTPHSSQDLAQ